MKLCILVMGILKMCMWVFDGSRINFDRITAFQTYLWQLFCTVGYEMCVINSSMNVSQTLQICCGQIGDVHVGF